MNDLESVLDWLCRALDVSSAVGEGDEGGEEGWGVVSMVSTCVCAHYCGGHGHVHVYLKATVMCIIYM